MSDNQLATATVLIEAVFEPKPWTSLSALRRAYPSLTGEDEEWSGPLSGACPGDAVRLAVTFENRLLTLIRGRAICVAPNRMAATEASISSQMNIRIGRAQKRAFLANGEKFRRWTISPTEKVWFRRSQSETGNATAMTFNIVRTFKQPEASLCRSPTIEDLFIY